LFDENNELMTIVNGNAKIYIYYHYYCFSNVQRSILKWYNIEMIFCWCGDAKIIFDISAPFIPNLFFSRFRTSISHKGAVPHRCAVRRCGRWCGSAHLCGRRPWLHSHHR